MRGRLTALVLLGFTLLTADGIASDSNRLLTGKLDGLNGVSRSLSDYLGTPLIINVWASWCGPCRAETASLERLAWMEGLGRFQVIGISTDDSRSRALTWLDSSNATISHFLDSKLYWERALGASRIPLTVFVNSEGRIVEKVRGAREWDSEASVAFVREFLEQP